MIMKIKNIFLNPKESLTLASLDKLINLIQMVVFSLLLAFQITQLSQENYKILTAGVAFVVSLPLVIKNPFKNRESKIYWILIGVYYGQHLWQIANLSNSDSLLIQKLGESFDYLRNFNFFAASGLLLIQAFYLSRVAAKEFLTIEPIQLLTPC